MMNVRWLKFDHFYVDFLIFSLECITCIWTATSFLLWLLGGITKNLFNVIYLLKIFYGGSCNNGGLTVPKSTTSTEGGQESQPFREGTLSVKVRPGRYLGWLTKGTWPQCVFFGLNAILYAKDFYRSCSPLTTFIMTSSFLNTLMTKLFVFF